MSDYFRWQATMSHQCCLCSIPNVGMWNSYVITRSEKVIWCLLCKVRRVKKKFHSVSLFCYMLTLEPIPICYLHIKMCIYMAKIRPVEIYLYCLPEPINQTLCRSINPTYWMKFHLLKREHATLMYVCNIIYYLLCATYCGDLYNCQIVYLRWAVT